MNNLFDYGTIVSDLDINRRTISYRSICYTPKMPLKKYLFKTNILQTEKYRPDKIAYRLFEDPTLSWVLDEINNLYSFKDYYPNREIYYLDNRGLNFIGIAKLLILSIIEQN